jgi:capsular exopolysaccharide synthesis family protein
MEDQFFIQQQASKAEKPGMSVKELLYKYIRFLPLIIISVAFALLGAYLYLRYTTPTFQSNGALVVKEDNGTAGGGGGTSGDRFQQMFVMDNSINIKNEIEIIRSRQLLKRVIEDLGINCTYFVKGKIKESNIYTASPIRLEAYEIADSSASFELAIEVVDEKAFRLAGEQKPIAFGQVFDTEQGVFRLIRNPVASLSNEYRILWQPTDVVAGDVANRLIVSPGAAAGIIQVLYEATNAELAADFINKLMQEYQVATREDKNETNRRMLDFIDSRLKGVERELDSVTRRLLAYQRENNLINAESQSAGYFTKIETTDEELNKERVQDYFAQMIDSYLSNQQNAYDLVPSSFSLEDGTLTTLIGAYNVAQLERKTLIDSQVPETNPAVKQKEDEIERLRVNILESLRNLRQAIAANMNRLQEANSRAMAEVRSLPIKEQNLLEIKTQQETKQAVYNLLLEKREQTAITLAGTISNMKVIEEARPKSLPIKPNRNTVLMIAVLAGLVLPALFIFGKEMLNDKVSSRQDVEKITEVPIVGEIGHSYEKMPLVVRPNHRGVVAEQFRILRSNLQYILPHVQKPVLMVTSSFSGEGKSYISTNLGAVMALANKKTVILEFDIRKPKVLSHLGITKKAGIINYLLGKASLEELPIPVAGYDHLYVVACGPIPPNPAELLLDEKLDLLFAYLKQNFDVIIIDTAPVGMVSDAMSLSRYTDATLYIVRQGYTFKKQVGMIDEFHAQGKLPKMSILINDVNLRSSYGYYGYGRYGYGYGDKKMNGYFDEEQPQVNGWRKWTRWIDMNKWDRTKTKA